MKLAKYLADRKRNVSLLLCDMTAPMLPCICPPGDLEFEHSLGSVLAATHVTQNLVRQNCVVHKHQDYLMILGMQKGENEYTYPPHSASQATELIDCLRELTPYVIIDCSSYIVNDILSAIALMEADSVLRLVGCDLKSISYLSSQLPLLQDHEWDADKQYRVASNIRPNEASEHVERVLGNVTFRIPHSAEVEEQILAGNLFKELSLKDSRGFRKGNRTDCQGGVWMLGEKRGESLFFQAEKAAEPKIVEMGPQTVERGIQAVEFHQPDHSGISATGTLHHPQKKSKRPEMPTDRKNGGVEVQEEEWEDDTTVGFVPGNGGPRNQGLFFSAREGREFAQVLQEVQEYVSSKYATLLTGHGDADVKAQIKRYITKYIQDYRIAVQGMTMVQLVDGLYTEMAEFSFLTKYIFGTGIEEVDVNGWNDIEVQYSDGRNEKLEEHFDSPEHAINVIRRMLHVSGMVLDNASPAVLGHLSKNIVLLFLRHHLWMRM